MSVTSPTGPTSPSSSASFLSRVIAASANWTADQKQQFRDFFCSDETDVQLIARLGITSAQLRTQRAAMTKLIQVTV